MRAWLDGDEDAPVVYLAESQRTKVVRVVESGPGLPPASAVELVTASSVVDDIRAELRGLPGMTPAARRALRQVLDRAAGARS